MGMMDCSRLSQTCLRPPLGSAVWWTSNATCFHAIPRRERSDVQVELVGIWDQPTQQEALIHLAAFKAKYAQRYPEAVRSLAEDEEHLLTFYAFPVSMHRHLQTTNAIESLAEQCAAAHRSDRRVHDGDQLPHHRVGHDPGYPLAPASR
jgi:transposase-like protein